MYLLMYLHKKPTYIHTIYYILSYYRLLELTKIHFFLLIELILNWL